jgi:NDP-4-keto-2,6-dideoxyhexose 3-C-methyltransferase
MAAAALEKNQMLYKEVADCRLCMGTKLVDVLDLGEQALTGVFPKSSTEFVPSGPLRLCKCETCDLVQLRHNYDLGQLYGENYGYRSGLNQSMVQHLQKKVARIRSIVELKDGDLIVDIGSNDSTTLQAYPSSLTLVGVDPSGPKFKSYYPAHVRLIPDFFSAHLMQEAYPGRRAKVITSIAMFYDLERPQSFVDEVASLLDEQGVWVFEQSYLPLMLESNSYDTACHEHLEYYALHQIKRMTDRAGLKIVDIEFNDINGGSFSVAAAKREAKYPEASALIASTLANENRLGLSSTETYRNFARTAADHREHLVRYLNQLKESGKKVIGYGASTKGNVLIQYCGLDASLVSCIAEVNQDKFGAFTPGSRIPIVSEADARAMKPDYFMVFPWHFRAGILKREQSFLAAGGKFIFPLPSVDVVSASGIETIWRAH